MDSRIIIFIIGQALAVLTGVIAIYVRMSLKIKELEMRMTAVERQDNTIVNKIDSIAEMLVELRLELQNKKDKD